MILLLSFLFLRMFIYVNTLYYSIALLLLVLTLLFILVRGHILHSLTIIMLAIVYIGAIIILIGYICAICPNLILSPLDLRNYAIVLFLITPIFLSPEVDTLVLDRCYVPMTNYFYSAAGGRIFLLLIFMLFVTLLIVTSQYITPKGPFRSVTI